MCIYFFGTHFGYRFSLKTLVEFYSYLNIRHFIKGFSFMDSACDTFMNLARSEFHSYLKIRHLYGLKDLALWIQLGHFYGFSL